MPRYLSPSVHDVERIEARPLVGGGGVELTMKGRAGTPDALFSIFGSPEDAGRYARLADAINAVFAGPVATDNRSDLSRQMFPHAAE